MKGRHRYVEFRDPHPDDLKYLWAAYKKGALNNLHEVFLEDMTSQEFREILEAFLVETGMSLWTLIAETKNGTIPAGMITGWAINRIISVSKIISFPWASDRNIMEITANAFDTMRKKVFDETLEIDDPQRYFIALVFTEFRDKKFYERIEDMGIIRKVGHVHDMQPSGTSILFQTRTPGRK